MSFLLMWTISRLFRASTRKQQRLPNENHTPAASSRPETEPRMSISLADCSIALIGGAGFIGHALALALRRKGGSVHVIDSLRGAAPAAQAARFEQTMNA